MCLRLAKLALGIVGALALASGAAGCVGDDTTLPHPLVDSGFTVDSSFPVIDSGGVDAESAPPDAGADAAAVDAAPEAGVDANVPEGGAPSTVGLVVGGNVSTSAHYVLTGNAAPAAGVVSKSTNYTLVGGLSVSTQTAK